MKFHKLNSVYTLDNGLPSSKLIAGFDLDHTLIKPKDNKVHPKDKEDIELCFPNIKEKLTELIGNGYDIVIFSNQSTFYKKEKQDIITKRIISFIKLMDIPIYVFISVLSDYCRKPNTGMWDDFLGNKSIDLSQSFYVGDAAGRNKNPQTGKKDFACSDRMFALNVGIRFYTPEKFFQPELYTKKEIYKIKKTWTTFSLEQPELDTEDYEVIILIGPPGSGKSSLSLTGFTFVSQDELKYKRNCIKLMNDTLKSGGKVVIDNTNAERDKRKSYIELAQKYGKKILAVLIDITKEQSMFLVNYRCKIKKNVKIPDVVIHTYFKNYEKPIKGEGFDKIVTRTFVPKLDEIKKVIFEQYL
jgi:bifunctional polynucleotide phosphatase/kinase